MAAKRAAAKKPEPVVVSGVKVTSPDRVVFTIGGRAVTKVDIARFVESVAPLMLPHVRGRPLTVVRCPSGSAGPGFFQKHVIKGMPAAIDAMEVMERAGPMPSLAVHDAAGLVGLVQMSALELHTWGSKEGDSETPDRIVIDLDPGEGVTWPAVVAAARRVRELLAADGLASFVKTTGGKGLHVVAPLDTSDAKRAATWHDTAVYAERFATQMVAAEPERYVANMKKALRKGRIFLDVFRNMRGATVIAPWSMRKQGGTVAVPVRWEELDDITGASWTVLDVAALLERGDDAWPGFFTMRQRLPPTS